MAKLVMQYSAGDIECTCEYVLCFEYESKEKFLFDLELAVINALEVYDQYYERYNAWEAKDPRSDSRISPKKMDEAVANWYNERPEGNPWNFIFAGQFFELRTFLVYSRDNTFKKKEHREFIPPSVMELEEWFQGKLQENSSLQTP